MNEVVLKIYVFLSIIIAATDIILGMKSIKKNKTTGRFLGLACIGAAIVDVSYLISIISDSYMAMSVMSSIYFVSIDYMLVCLLIFIVYFTEGRFSKWGRAAIGVCFFYCLYELVIFAINPFKNIAIGYVRRDTVIAKYSYDMKPLYDMHLVFSYALVCVVLILLVKKLCKIPHEYRLQYSSVILGLLALVGINAIFLYVPGAEVYKLLDYSICGYSLTSYILYWSCFNYSTHGMLNKLKTNIFENIGQGIVLFDYDNHLILHNDRADDFLGKELLCKCENLQQFLETYDLSVDLAADDDSFSLQCYIKGDDGDRPLRCDIRRLDNKEGRRLGQMFVFSDISLETDMLTGFQKWDSFQRLAMEEVDHFTFPVGVAICDINGLSVINSTRGNQAGDHRINALAGIMRKNFPERTYYVRGIDAHLIALCSHSSEEEMAACVEKVKEQYDGSIQYAVGGAADEGQHHHTFLYSGWEAHTDGNPLTHCILRGALNKHGQSISNYHYEDLRLLADTYKKFNLVNHACIVDANHNNSGKKFIEQPRIVKEIIHSRNYDSEIKNLVKGVMVESYIEDGNQPVDGGCYGKSITDPCLGWDKTERLLKEVADLL